MRSGTLWEGRYKATLIDSEAYLLTCMRYIELNPVRAEMVAHPSDYPWSSYRREPFKVASRAGLREVFERVVRVTAGKA